MKRIYLLIAITAIFLFSCSTPIRKKGCIKGNCRNGRGVFVFDNGNRYEGDFRGGKPFGYGTMYYKNGVKLEGRWRWGKPDLR